MTNIYPEEIIYNEYPTSKGFHIDGDFQDVNIDNIEDFNNRLISVTKDARIQLGYTDIFPVYNPMQEYEPLPDLLDNLKIIWTNFILDAKEKNKITFIFKNENVVNIVYFFINNGKCFIHMLSYQNVCNEDNIFMVLFETDSNFEVTDKFDRWFNTEPIKYDVPDNAFEEQERYIQILRDMKYIHETI